MRFPALRSPRRSRGGRCRTRFASRCPIRARVPTTSRASRCCLLPRVRPSGDSCIGQNLGDGSRVRDAARCSFGFSWWVSELAVFPGFILSLKKTERINAMRTRFQSRKSDISHDFPGRWPCVPPEFFHNIFKTCALRRRGNPRVARIYIQQPLQHSTNSIRYIRPAQRQRGSANGQSQLSRARGARTDTQPSTRARAFQNTKTNALALGRGDFVYSVFHCGSHATSSQSFSALKICSSMRSGRHASSSQMISQF